jgi:hypothetical protein
MSLPSAPANRLPQPTSQTLSDKAELQRHPEGPGQAEKDLQRDARVLFVDNSVNRM